MHNQREMILRGWMVSDYKETSQEVIRHLEDNDVQVLNYSDPELYAKVFSLLDMQMPEDTTRLNVSQKIDDELYEKYKTQVEGINQIDIELYEHFREKA